jgi:NTP pyrophosphatase (non-canonical NTP hydrolase)
MSSLHLKKSPTLADLQQYVDEMITERNFRNSKEFLPHRFMMLMEEVGEFARAARKEAGLKFADDTKRAEMSHEAADVFIHLLGLCNMLDIDLEQAFRDKEELNKLRTWK